MARAAWITMPALLTPSRAVSRLTISLAAVLGSISAICLSRLTSWFAATTSTSPARSALPRPGPPTDPLPEWVPGWLNADGTISPCTGAPTLGTGAIAGLGPFFGGALGSGLRTVSSGLEDYNNDVANAIYHGGTLTVLKRGKFFNLTANYTYSHIIDNGNFTTFINLPPNQFDYASERANSNQDARHRLVANFTAIAPKNGPWRNFELSNIVTLQSGRPFTIYYGSNTLNDVAGGSTDRVGGSPFIAKATCPDVQDCQTMIPQQHVHRRSVLQLGPARNPGSAHQRPLDSESRVRCVQPAQPGELR